MHPQTSHMELKFDTVIIGGGPAGSSCALWLKMLGYKPCIIEKRSRLGGLQNDSPYLNQWIAVLPDCTGQQVAENIHQTITSHAIPFYLNSTVTQIELIENQFNIHFKNKDLSSSTVLAPYLVIASGVVPISGGLTSSEHILIGPGKEIEDYSFVNKRVAILGGGDNAFENYEFIKQKGANTVHIYAQQDKKHTIKARYEFLVRVPKKDVILYQENIKINADKKTINDEYYDVIIVLYGWTAVHPFLSSLKLKMNAKGFIETHPKTLESSHPGIYAIGEVTQHTHPCCVTAMADGVVAAKAIQNRLDLSHSR